MRKSLILILLCSLFFSSCKVFMPMQLLRASKAQISDFPEEERYTEYKVAPNDMLRIQVYIQDGENIFENTLNYNNNNQYQNQGLDFLVEFDGVVKIPSIGRIKVSGLTLRQVEDLLEKEFSNSMKSPMVKVSVSNHRVTIFPGGEGGTASVVTLTNTNTTVIEALAMAGGIKDGKGYNIKLIRGDLKNPTVYKIDLSTIDGMRKANLTLKANDIIYVEPRLRPVTRFLNELAPYLNLVNTALVITGYINNFQSGK